MNQVYLHGLGQTPVSWEQTILTLQPAADSICLNLVGLVRGIDATYQNLFAAFSDYCDQFEGIMDLCGLSLGGVLALNYAIEHPEKVRSLVLIAAQYKMPKTLLRFQNVLFRLMPGQMFQKTGFRKADFLRLCGTMLELDFSSSLPKVACPALVICGGKDSANKKAAVELASLLPKGELQVLDGVGHEVNLEAPERLAETLRDFYGRFPVDKG